MDKRSAINSQITLVGHPFAPIGMGEHLRAVFRALRAVGAKVGVRDVYEGRIHDADLQRELSPYMVRELSPEINIFCLNGDEIEPALNCLSTPLPSSATNIAFPAWELSKYPKAWAEQLNKFDEIWSASTFTQDSIRSCVGKPVVHMPLPGEIRLRSFLGRRYFGIPESSFAFLFFFDFTSYIERKNPFAVLQAFEELCRRCPTRDVFLIIKIKGGESKNEDYERFCAEIGGHAGQFSVIDKLLSDNEIKNLLRCCDCFVSLHRAEGFGLGLTAAMYLGKPVIATGYSGNLDYMSEANSCLVRHSLCSVPNGAYPFAEGQRWAEPDIADAVDHMARLVSDRDYALKIGENARRDLRVNFSNNAVGLRYLDRIRNIIGLRSELDLASFARGAVS